ncbi:alpha/beta hydrolase family protein [Streptomyces sulphureus]|uniref:alpha/beta hydrolase family protein n=1 Tax=Streptomyces sulphureus TaxID=47758 RepID=UPI0003810FCE|nr:alpha/beta hydrolase [Streptomyces sulphureus]
MTKEPRLPAPTGPSCVGTRRHHLVDEERVDPHGASPRELMVRAWFPTTRPDGGCPGSYLAEGVAQLTEKRFSLPPGVLSDIRTHALSDAPPDPAVPDAPLLLFGGGRQDPAELCTALAEDLASHGYVVVGVDHTHDSPAEFPDGRVVPGGPMTRDPEELRAYSDLRAADLSFVLDVLGGTRGPSPLARLRRAGGPVRAGVFGHSLGGSAAAEALHGDPRFVAGASVDGMLFGSAVVSGLTRPFLLITEAIAMPSWDAFMHRHRAWGRRIEVRGAGHYSFTDLALLLAASGADAPWTPEERDRLFGTLEAPSVRRTTATCARRFFDAWLSAGHAPADDLADGCPQAAVTWRTDGPPTPNSRA